MTFLLMVVITVLVFLKTSSLQEQIKDLRSEMQKMRLLRKTESNQEQPSNGVAMQSAEKPHVTVGDMLREDVDMSQTPAEQLEAMQRGEMSRDGSLYSRKPSVVDQFVDWFKDNWMLKIGILLIIAGFGWFVSYAFVYNWIGPVGRITFGFVLGGAVALFGDFRMKKSTTQGGAFLVLGSAIILITVFAARFIYSFLNPYVALILVFLVGAYITLNAIRYNLRTLAFIGLVMATFAPTFTNSSDINVIERFLYIGIVSFSSIWVMFHKNWREIGATAAMAVGGYSIYYGLFSNLGTSEYPVLLIAYLISFIFFVANIISIIKFKDEANSADGLLAFVNGALVILWTMAHIPDVWQSLFLALWMAIFAVGSFIVFSKTRNSSFFYIYASIAVVLLVVATAIELDGTALLFAFIFESAIISMIGYVITGRPEIGERLTLFLIAPILMSTGSIFSSRWRTEVFHEDFFVLLSIIAVTFGLGLFYLMKQKEMNSEYRSGLELHPYSLMLIAGSAYAYVLIWLSLGALYESSISVLLSLAIYTIVGIITHFYGKFNERKVYVYYGGTLLLFVIGRLILIDVWNMDLAFRIATFVLIGLLFVGTSFIGKKEKKLQ